MRLLIQRVSRASVSTSQDGVVGEIGRGLCVFFGAGSGDGVAELEACLDKTLGLRIFPDDDGKMDRSVVDVGGDVLVVPQFTLYADISSGRRPGFSDALNPGEAERLFDDFADRLADDDRLATVERGVFGASMDVDLTNAGPVTIWVDSEEI